MKADWAFKMFDYDGNGKLDANDIRYVVKALTDTVDDVAALEEEDEEDVEGNQKVCDLISARCNDVIR